MTSTPKPKTNNNDLFAKEGLIHMVISILLTFFGLILCWPIGIVFFIFTIFTFYFFRNPKRQIPLDPQVILAPADGTVIAITEEEERYFSKTKQKRITIFMSPFNVHVNRSPILGTISNTHYQKGRFLAAFSERASLENEQSALEIVSPANQRLVFVQIAGWLARRIVSYPEKGTRLDAGEIFGVIRFGSRMDVYLPLESKIEVKLQQKVYAGESLLARWS